MKDEGNEREREREREREEDGGKKGDDEGVKPLQSKEARNCARLSLDR